MGKTYKLDSQNAGCRGRGSPGALAGEESYPTAINYISIDNYYQYYEANAYG